MPETPASNVPGPSESLATFYGLTAQDVSDLSKFVVFFSKNGLEQTFYHLALRDKVQRRIVRLYPQLEGITVRTTGRSTWLSRLLVTCSDYLLVVNNAAHIVYDVFGRRDVRSKQFVYDTIKGPRRIVENGLQFGVIIDTLRMCSDPEVLAILPSKALTDWLGTNAGRHLLDGTPFNVQPASYPSRSTFDGTDEL